MHRYPQPRQLHGIRAFLRWIHGRIMPRRQPQQMKDDLSAGGRGGSDTSVTQRPSVPRAGTLPATRPSTDRQPAGGITSANADVEGDAGTLSLTPPGTSAGPPVVPAGPE